MQIRITNFRQYSGFHEFTFTDTGATLIVGTSGAGKTTIIEAIYVCLYGARGIDSNCTLILNDDWACIERKFGPSSIEVITANKTLVGDVAQEAISRHYGNNFELTSYVRQQSSISFLTLSPQERLEKLEYLLFQDSECNPKKHRIECQKHIKALQERLTFLGGMAVALEKIVGKSTLDIDADARGEKYGELYAQFLQNRQYLWIAYKSTEQKLVELSSIEKPSHADTLTFTRLETHLRALSTLKELGYSSPRHAPESAWQELSRESAEEIIEDIEQELKMVGLKEEIDSLTAQYEQKKAEMFLEREASAHYSCPLCKGRLVLADAQLCAISSESAQFVAQYESLLTKYQEMETEYGPPENSYTCLIQNKQFYENYISTQQKLAESLAGLIARDYTLQDVDKARKWLSMRVNVADAKTKLEHLHKEAEKANLKDESAQLAKVSQLARAQEYRQQMNEYRNVQNEMKELREQITAAERLREILSWAASECVVQCCKKITEQANYYASLLFDTPLTVELIIAPSAGKSNLRIQIQYGNRMDISIQAMSGGEVARLQLCFTLAFTNFFGGRILLLDEALNPLDSTTTERALDVIRGALPPSCKLIVVAHQMIEGWFEQIIHC